MKRRDEGVHDASQGGSEEQKHGPGKRQETMARRHMETRTGKESADVSTKDMHGWRAARSMNACKDTHTDTYGTRRVCSGPNRGEERGEAHPA